MCIYCTIGILLTIQRTMVLENIKQTINEIQSNEPCSGVLGGIAIWLWDKICTYSYNILASYW